MTFLWNFFAKEKIYKDVGNIPLLYEPQICISNLIL